MQLRIRFSLLLLSLVITRANAVSLAAELPHDPVHLPLAADISFDHYVDLQQVADALRAKNAATLTDLAMQMAEAERILLRSHNSKLTSSELMVKAAQLAAGSQDKDSLARLSKFAAASNNSSLIAQFKAAEKLSAGSRVPPPESSVPLQGTDVESLLEVNEWMNCIRHLENSGDRESLHAVREAIDGASPLSDSQKATLISLVDNSVRSVGEPDADDLLRKLTSTGRGWDPKKTIGKVADGDIVGAISGADFRIPSNETVLTGQSGRAWTMIYTLTNRTQHTITARFVTSGNTSRIAPGKTITCRSRASAWGSEKTGVKYDYPKVQATAPNGKRWLRTISRDGEDYFVVQRNDGSIQIVP